MIRFFIRPEQMSSGTVTLEADDAYHLRTVLKAQPGQEIAVLDGSGREWPATVTEIGKTKATAEIRTPTQPPTEPRTAITIAQALPKVAEKMEQVLQRGTEVGATDFWAYESARSLTHLAGERHDKRLGRWAAIIKTAAEQAHRARLPGLRVEGGLADVLAAAPKYDLALLADAAEGALPLRQTLASAPRSVLVIVGPESGFAHAELSKARSAGVQAVSLGPRTLRTETAALVLAAQILFALENAD